MGVGSELVQGFLPNGRTFDPYDILANLVGSLAATGLASLYHKRMLDRRRQHKYSTLATEGEEGEDDVELGVGPGAGTVGGEQESGVISGVSQSRSLEDEVDNWDENAVDEAWDEDEGSGNAGGKMTPPSSTGDEHDVKLAKD